MQLSPLKRSFLTIKLTFFLSKFDPGRYCKPTAMDSGKSYKSSLIIPSLQTQLNSQIIDTFPYPLLNKKHFFFFMTCLLHYNQCFSVLGKEPYVFQYNYSDWKCILLQSLKRAIYVFHKVFHIKIKLKCIYLFYKIKMDHNPYYQCVYRQDVKYFNS